MDYVPVFGLGAATTVDSLVIDWDPNMRTKLTNVTSDTTLVLSVSDAVSREKQGDSAGDAKFELTAFSHRHIENPYVDFDRERLIYHQLSKEGPGIATADLNGDGLDDFFIGGAAGQPGSIYINDGADNFLKIPIPAFIDHQDYEDVDAAFFDADQDGDQDLYVVSGGNEFVDRPDLLNDRIYFNDGWRGRNLHLVFKTTIPPTRSSGSCVRPADFDEDGDIDLFIGTRSVPGQYGKPASSILLENDGSGNFTDVSGKLMSQLANIGLVTDASWNDYDNDGDTDLAIVGEWMPVVIFENRGNFFQRKFNVGGLENSHGWWMSVKNADVNGDGSDDLILGNWGENSMFQASIEEPVRLYISDYDDNGTLDQIFTKSHSGKFIPYHVRNDLGMQLTEIKKRYPSFTEYADKDMSDIFTEGQLLNSIQLDVFTLKSAVAFNNGDGTYNMKPLPFQAQLSPIFEITLVDDNVILMGNFSGTKPEEGIYNANHGLILRNSNGAFQPVPQSKTGFKIRDDVRAMKVLKGTNSSLLIVGKNNQNAQIYKFN